MNRAAQTTTNPLPQNMRWVDRVSPVSGESPSLELLSALRTAIACGPSRNASTLFCLVVCCLLPFGCGYTVGNAFNRDIKTVAVPIFENKTNRLGIEKQLTEAVQKELTRRSPYRLAKGLEADTRLTGKIVTFRKDVLGETRYDDPRELQISLMVHVEWEDLRSGQVLAQQEIPLNPSAIPMAAQAEFAPEIGQSLATAMDDAMNRMAKKIVDLMETPAW